MEKVYNKLVRDNIPDIIKNNNEVPFTKVLGDDEYKMELDKKLLEECNEVLSSSGDDRLHELADVIEVVSALAKIEGKNLNNVITIANEKSNKRGAFDKKIFLEKVISKDSENT